MTVEITKTLDFLKCPGTAEVTFNEHPKRASRNSDVIPL